MLNRRFVMVLAIALVAGVATTPVALAGSIGVDGHSGPGLGSVTVTNLVTGAANNNDYTGAGASNPNQLAMEKEFEAVDYIDTVINVTDTEGITEYWVTESVTNSTSHTWIDFHFFLGYGTGRSFVGSNGDLLDFDEPVGGSGEVGGGVPNPTSDKFSSYAWVVLPDELDFFDGSVAPGETVTFGFSIDVPDWNEEIPVGEAGGYSFTLREIPTVPEASTYLLFSLGALGLLAWRRRSKAD
jgi:hypothetical protein